MPSKHTTIYIGVEEEITSVVERIKKTPAGEIALIVPRRSFLSQGVVNLKILRSQSEKTGKQLAIVTRDPLCRSLAKKVGLQTNSKLDSEILKRTKVEAPPPQTRIQRRIQKKKNFPKNFSLGKKYRQEPVPSGGLRRKENTVPNTADIIKAPIDGIKPSFSKKEQKTNHRLDTFKKKNDSASAEIENFKKEYRAKANKTFLFFKNLVSKVNFNGTKKRKKRIRKIIFLPSSSVHFLLLFILALVGVIITAAFFILPKAEIEITPKKEALAANLDIKIDSNVSKPDPKKGIIPGKEIKKEIVAEEDFKASGKVTETYNDNKIRGNLTVYNEFSSSLEVFVPQTRFITEEGQVFRSVSSVRLPGYTKQAGEVIPGKTVIEVVADKEGDEYLISNQKLTVPGLKGGERYEKIYAMVEEPFKKPTERGDKEITDEDIKKGKESIIQILEEKAQADILKNNSGFEIIGVVILEEVQLTEDKPVGSRAENFSIRGEAIAKVLIFKRKDLEELAASYLAEEVAKNQIFLGNCETEIVEFKIGEEGKSANLNVRAEGYKSEKIEGGEIKDKILGLSEEEAFERLELLDKIETFEINCWPFWVRNIPKKREKVQINIIYQ